MNSPTMYEGFILLVWNPILFYMGTCAEFYQSMIIGLVILAVNFVYGSRQWQPWDNSKVGIAGTAEDMIPQKYNVCRPFQKMDNILAKRFANMNCFPAHVMTFNVAGNLNVGMCIRTAAVFGLSTVHIVGRRSYDKRSAVGAQNYLRAIERWADLGTDPVEWFRSRQLFPILIEQGGTMLTDTKFGQLTERFTLTPVFIAGSESHGIPKFVLHALRTSPRITIQQHGLVRSLNVSNAVAIVLQEYAAQQTRYIRDIYGV